MRVCRCVRGSERVLLRRSDAHYPSSLSLSSAQRWAHSAIHYTHNSQSSTYVSVCMCAHTNRTGVCVCMSEIRAQGLKSTQQPVAVILALKTKLIPPGLRTMSHGTSYILHYSPQSINQRVTGSQRQGEVESKWLMKGQQAAACYPNHEAYTVAKTTVCMCGGVWVCVCVCIAYKYRLCRQRGDCSSRGYMPLCPPRCWCH